MSSHRPRKRFGQHFLHDPLVIDRIIASVNPQAHDHVVEIGPGEGVLTAPLVRSPARITAIEIDRDLAGALRARYQQSDLHVVEQDALRIVLSDLCEPGQSIRIVGNLPYNISTPLIFHLLKHASYVEDMHIMVQKEVADRLASPHGSRQYGRLTIMTAVQAEVQHLFDVGPGAFRPPPKVNSSVVRLIPRATPLVHEEQRATFAELVQLCFSQRRKTLRRTLGRWLSNEAIEACGVDPTVRPEQVPVNAYVELASHLHAARKLTHNTCG